MIEEDGIAPGARKEIRIMATPEKDAQKARAARLRQQVNEVLETKGQEPAAGEAKPLPSPREFIQREMAKGKGAKGQGA